MKKIFLILILFFVAAPYMSAYDNDGCLIIYCTEDSETDDDSDDDWYVEPDPSRKKTPSAPVMVNVCAKDGLSIPGVDSSEILSFEIRDAYGNTVAILTDEDSFIATLFSLSGEYRLLFRLPGRTLAGWILI